MMDSNKWSKTWFVKLLLESIIDSSNDVTRLLPLLQFAVAMGVFSNFPRSHSIRGQLNSNLTELKLNSNFVLYFLETVNIDMFD